MKTLVRIAMVCLLFTVCTTVCAQKVLLVPIKVPKAPRVEVPKVPRVEVPKVPRVEVPKVPRVGLLPPPPITKIYPIISDSLIIHEPYVSPFHYSPLLQDSAIHSSIEEGKKLMQRNDTIAIAFPSLISDSTVIYNPQK